MLRLPSIQEQKKWEDKRTKSQNKRCIWFYGDENLQAPDSHVNVESKKHCSCLCNNLHNWSQTTQKRFIREEIVPCVFASKGPPWMKRAINRLDRFIASSIQRHRKRKDPCMKLLHQIKIVDWNTRSDINQWSKKNKKLLTILSCL